MPNQREFFRLRLSVPFSFAILEAQDPKVPTNQTFTFQTQDLSGGGLRFESALPLEAGDCLQLKLIFPGSATIDVKATVVWCDKVRAPDIELYTGGIRFEGISEEEQDTIVGHLFQAQIEARKKARVINEVDAD